MFYIGPKYSFLGVLNNVKVPDGTDGRCQSHTQG